jgi:competence ComEA-like helix-hairpin-helix protein
MRKLVLVFVVILFLQLVLASCVDINTASLSELDEITYVGPATAQKIVDARPFDSIEDMIRVYGIGEVKLQSIKDQGLACVDGEENPKDSLETEKEEEIEYVKKEIKKVEYFEADIIKLSPQTIKSKNDSQDSINGDYATYGLIIFCVLLAGLWLIKLKKEKYKQNEFRDGRHKKN